MVLFLYPSSNPSILSLPLSVVFLYKSWPNIYKVLTKWFGLPNNLGSITFELNPGLTQDCSDKNMVVQEQ